MDVPLTIRDQLSHLEQLGGRQQTGHDVEILGVKRVRLFVTRLSIAIRMYSEAGCIPSGAVRSDLW
jgi:hypothetical protein